jgi:hypothetical protein
VGPPVATAASAAVASVLIIMLVAVVCLFTSRTRDGVLPTGSLQYKLLSRRCNGGCCKKCPGRAAMANFPQGNFYNPLQL